MRSIVLVAAALMAAGCAALADVPEQIAVLETAVPAALSRHRAEGAAVALVAEGDVVWSAGFGVADAATGEAVTAETVFEAASVAKPVTAWAVVRLAEQGRLDLDAPIETYLKRWSLPPSRFDHSGVTARLLLAHAAGISFGGDPGVEPGDTVPTLTEAADGAGMEGGGIRVAFPPGEAYRYSSKGYLLLELAVEDITGEPFADHMRREVLEPLGMSFSAYEWTPGLELRAATGHDWFGTPLPRYVHATKAQGGLLTTASDLARFIAAAMPGPDGAMPGRGVISVDSVAMTFAPYPYANDTSLVGLGYNLDTSSGTLVARKSGDHRGFKPIVFTAPNLGAGLVILTNSDRAAAGVFADIACPWSRTLAADPLSGICGTLHLIRNLHWGAAALFAGLALAFAARPVSEIVAGTRKPGPGTRWRAAAFVCLVLLLILWWSFWYTDVPLGIFGYPSTFVTVRFDPWPTAFIWVSWAVSALIASIALRTATRHS